VGTPGRRRPGHPTGLYGYRLTGRDPLRSPARIRGRERYRPLARRVNGAEGGAVGHGAMVAPCAQPAISCEPSTPSPRGGHDARPTLDSGPPVVRPRLGRRALVRPGWASPMCRHGPCRSKSCSTPVDRSVERTARQPDPRRRRRSLHGTRAVPHCSARAWRPPDMTDTAADRSPGSCWRRTPARPRKR